MKKAATVTTLLATFYFLGLLAERVLASEADVVDAGLIMGRVELTACTTNERSEQAFGVGIRLLYHFMFPLARAAFVEAQKSDPMCVLAFLGESLTHNQRFWGYDDVAAGREALSRARETAAVRQRATKVQNSVLESALFDAINKLWLEGATVGERMRGYVESLNASRAVLSDFDDVHVLFVGAVLTETFPYQRGYTRRMAPFLEDCASTLYAVLQRNPQHPGALHFALHLHDTPHLAQQGLYAGTYAVSSSSIPHALHMPSHLHLRLGMWAAAAAANEAAVLQSDTVVASLDLDPCNAEFHNHEFLHYARLQQGRFDDAWRLVQLLQALAHRPSCGNGYVVQRSRVMRARLAAERGLMTGDWTDANALNGTTYPCVGCGTAADGNGDLLWIVEVNAATAFAKGLGAVALGNFETARAMVISLQSQSSEARDAGQYSWFQAATVVDIMAWSLEGWVLRATSEAPPVATSATLHENVRGSSSESLHDSFAPGSGNRWETLLQRAADLEQSTNPPGYDPVFPIIPSHELLGMLLLEHCERRIQTMDGYLAGQRAFQNFQEALVGSPGRSLALLGSARAALCMGDEMLAGRWLAEFRRQWGREAALPAAAALLQVMAARHAVWKQELVRWLPAAVWVVANAIALALAALVTSNGGLVGRSVWISHTVCCLAAIVVAWAAADAVATPDFAVFQVSIVSILLAEGIAIAGIASRIIGRGGGGTGATASVQRSCRKRRSIIPLVSCGVVTTGAAVVSFAIAMARRVLGGEQVLEQCLPPTLTGIATAVALFAAYRHGLFGGSQSAYVAVGGNNPDASIAAS